MSLLTRRCIVATTRLGSSRAYLRGTRNAIAYIPQRAFSSTQAAKESSKFDIKKLKINQGRLMKTLHETCAWGTGKRWGDGPNETGMSRLALSDSDKQARDWFVETTSNLGCEVKIDEMGNIFAVRPGRQDGPATFAGSHLDTQPTGGRYDGILGIMAGIEMLRVLKDHDIETEFPVGVVNWTNEEGARFPISMVSSGVWAGEIPLSTAHNLAEVGSASNNKPATMKSELSRIGYLGSMPCSYEAMPMGAHFELHIEQGPILTTTGQKIGIVKGVQAYKWHRVEVTGREAHTGTTPLEHRADPLLLAARLIARSHRVAMKHNALASTGILTLTPGSTNTIPGHVAFSLDVRAASDQTVEDVERELKRDFEDLASGANVDGLYDGLEPPSGPAIAYSGAGAGEQKSQRCKVSWRLDSDSPAVLFDPACVAAVRGAATTVTDDGTAGDRLVRDMTSGAGHDSVYTNYRCPTAMIFVPSRNGISHHPEEFTSDEDCAIGAEALLQSVLGYDRGRGDGRW